MQILINNNEFTGKVVNAEINNTLNEINKAEINITATNAFERDLLSIDNEVTFIDNNDKTLKFTVVNEALTENNSIKLICRGIEEVFANEKLDISSLSNASVTRTRNATYNNVSFTNIINDLISPFTSWSLTTTISATIGNYRVNDDQSYWNAIAKLCNEQAYEIDIDYINKEILIEENLGNNQVATLNEDMDFEGTPTYTIERAKGKKVIVYGKGDGDFQIKATATDASYSIGQPVIKIYDSNIVTNSQAQTRADNELTKLKQTIKHYIIPQLTKNIELNISDTIILNSDSVFIDNEELKIVRVIYSIQGNTQFKSIEVTNAEYSRAFKTAQQRINEQNLLLQENNTNMQGSGNTLNWSRALNANSTAPLRTVFYIPESYLSDSGNLEISSLEVDYEIEPFREGAGSASEDSVSPNLTSSTNTDSHNHNARDFSSHDHILPLETATNTRILNNEGVESFSSSIDNSWKELRNETFTENYDLIVVHVLIDSISSISGSGPLYIRLERGGTTLACNLVLSDISEFVVPISTTLIYPSFGNTDGFNFDVDAILSSFGNSCLISGDIFWNGMLRDHTHDIGPYNSNNENANITDDNESPGVTGAAEGHTHNVVIGDNVADASLINATGVSLYLDYYDPTDPNANSDGWVQKNSILNTGNILDTDVDISDGGTYPDTAGYWRVRTKTNSTSADFVETIVRMKHNLNNS